MNIPEGDLDLLAVGEAVVDFISVEEAASLREAHTFRRFPGGAPANVAACVARLGGRAALIAKVGADAFGRFLQAALQQAGVRTDHLALDPEAHTTAVFIARTQDTPDFAAFRGADARLRPDEVREDVVQRAKVVHASAFALSREPSRSAVEKALRLAHRHAKLVSLDPNYSPQVWPDGEEAQAVLHRVLRYVTLTKPSLDDAQRLFGAGQPPEAYIARYHEMGARIVVLTMGAQGVLLSDGNALTHIPAQPVRAVDVTGAGDAFWAGFLIAWLDGNPLPRCVRFAQEIARRKLMRVGPLQAPIDRHAVYADLGRVTRPG